MSQQYPNSWLAVDDTLVDNGIIYNSQFLDAYIIEGNTFRVSAQLDVASSVRNVIFGGTSLAVVLWDSSGATVTLPVNTELVPNTNYDLIIEQDSGSILIGSYPLDAVYTEINFNGTVPDPAQTESFYELILQRHGVTLSDTTNDQVFVSTLPGSTFNDDTTFTLSPETQSGFYYYVIDGTPSDVYQFGVQDFTETDLTPDVFIFQSQQVPINTQYYVNSEIVGPRSGIVTIAGLAQSAPLSITTTEPNRSETPSVLVVDTSIIAIDGINYSLDSIPATVENGQEIELFFHYLATPGRTDTITITVGTYTTTFEVSVDAASIVGSNYQVVSPGFGFASDYEISPLVFSVGSNLENIVLEGADSSYFNINQASGSNLPFVNASYAELTKPFVNGVAEYNFTVSNALYNVSQDVLVKVTESAIDRQPEQFSFAVIEDAEPNTVVTSELITITGIDFESEVSITGTPSRATNIEYSINGGPFTDDFALINNNETLQIRYTTSNTLSTQGIPQSHSVNVLIGPNTNLGTSAEFRVVNRYENTEVAVTPFSFLDIDDATFGNTYFSNIINLEIANGPAVVAFLNFCTLYVNGVETNTPANVNDGDTIQLRIIPELDENIAVLSLNGEIYTFTANIISSSANGTSIEGSSVVGTGVILVQPIQLSGNSVESQTLIGIGSTSTEVSIKQITGYSLTSHTFAGIGGSNIKYKVKGKNIESITLSGKTYKFNPRIRLNLH